MRLEQIYLSENIQEVIDITGLCFDELELLVGTFTCRSQWAGKLRGKLVLYPDMSWELRHHFGDKLILKGEDAC
jgi:hypothetical protein